MNEDEIERLGEIELRDPPAPRRGPASTWPGILRPLVDRPGRWGMVRRFKNPRTAVWHCTKLRHTPSRRPPGSWEFRSAVAEDGSGDGELFARYLGPAESSAQAPRLVAIRRPRKKKFLR